MNNSSNSSKAMLYTMAEARLERQELREGMIQLQSAVERLANIEYRK